MKLLMSFTTVPLVRLTASIGVIFSGFGPLAIRYLGIDAINKNCQ